MLGSVGFGFGIDWNGLDCIGKHTDRNKADAITMVTLHRLSPEFASAYKNAWADNADHLSFLYSGTGALKTDYTRTGKRTVCSSGTLISLFGNVFPVYF